MEKIITTTCSYDCGARCLLKVHLKDGMISRITSGNVKGLGISACPKGLAQKDVVYSPERIMQPLKRTGKRGEGRFEAISWDEALDTIAGQLKKTIKEFGTESIYYLVNTGSLSTLQNTRAAVNRFFALLGKCTTAWCNVSFEGALQSSLATFGTPYTGGTRDNLLFSKLLILWGWDPLVSRFGSDTESILAKAKKSGLKIISVDPKKNRSCRYLSDEWISIRPGTDAAMLIAMAYVMIDEGLYDKDFIIKYTDGFEAFKSYVMGAEDSILKNPVWAQLICGVPAETIAWLARQYAQSKPAALITGWAPGRSAAGEQFHRAASVLAAMTGNIGVKGGFVSGGADFVGLGLFNEKVPVGQSNHNIIHKADFYDAIINGTLKKYPADCRLLYITGCNLLNQYLNLNKGIQALLKPDFIVLHELFLTPTAKYADIILPVTHFLERDDIGHPWLGGPYLIFMNKVVDNLNGPKSDFEILSELAPKVGIKDYNNNSDEEWLKVIMDNEPDFPDINTLKKDGVYKIKHDRPFIPFKEQIKDIKNNPFPTPSGKIEIYSSRFEQMNNPLIPAIPKYIPFSEGVEDAESNGNFPLQLITPHSRARVNSQFVNVKGLKKLEDDNIYISIKDAQARDINNSDNVFVFNDRGRIFVKAKVTRDIMPGVVSLDQGQWYNPDEGGTDIGGCVNVLSSDKASPAGAFTSNTCLVQVEKAAPGSKKTTAL
jgi:anaerobic dimethyl sulfoxide reductase subunit A